MIKLLKPYTTEQVATGVPPWPAAEPGEAALPFEKSLERAIVETLVAAGTTGVSSEDIQRRFKLTSKLTGHIMKKFKSAYKVSDQMPLACNGEECVFSGDFSK
jgi:hypothetical protein